MDVLSIKKHHLIVSRGATAIYLILKNEGLNSKKVLVPANICYAAVYPVIYSGNIPLFCDVDQSTGNVTKEIFAKYSEIIDAFIVPHMYGNPNEDVFAISEICKEKNILLIEDCASAMGAVFANGQLCGAVGEYSIFSTGYSKTVDLGSGGIILSEKPVNNMEKTYRSLAEKTVVDQYNEEFFSRIYRVIRNNPGQTLSKMIWKSLEKELFTVFIHYESGIEDKVIEGLNELDKTINLRTAKCSLYNTFLKENEEFIKYNFSSGAVPWRYCVFIPKDKHRVIIDYLLENNVPVSDWYPNVTPIFGDRKSFKNVDNMESSIINFPLLLEDEEIIRICGLMNRYR